MPRATYDLAKTRPRYFHNHRSATAPLSMQRSRVSHDQRRRWGRVRQSRIDHAHNRDADRSEYNF